MLFVAGLSQFIGFAVIALFADMALVDDMLLPLDDMLSPVMAFDPAFMQLCVALIALWLVIALPLDDMELVLDIELPCAKA